MAVWMCNFESGCKNQLWCGTVSSSLHFKKESKQTNKQKKSLQKNYDDFLQKNKTRKTPTHQSYS
jgi:hypothetical protein